LAISPGLQAKACGKGAYVKIYIVLETDYEWTEIRRAFKDRVAAEQYVSGLPTGWKEHYHYPIEEVELE